MFNSKKFFRLGLAGFLALAWSLHPSIAHAYIDPGTTSMVVGGAAGVIAWSLLIVAFLRRKIWQGLRWSGRQFIKHPLLATLIVALPLLAIAGLVWNGSKEKQVNPATITGDHFERVLLIGIDGTDPDDVRSLMDKGLLPNFKRLSKAGSMDAMDIANPAESPVVWSSLASGKNPGGHGIFDFIGRAPQTYLPQLTVLHPEGDGYSYPLKAKAFWDYTAAAKLPTTIIRWPLTFPPKRIDAKVLAGLGVPDLQGGLGHYSFFTDEKVDPSSDGFANVVPVVVDKNVFTSTLRGPKTRGLTGLKTLTVPLEGKVGADGASVLLSVGKQRYALAEGQWSDWVELSFSSGLFGKTQGLVKFYLVKASAPLQLYASAVELHPDAPAMPFTQPPEYSAELRKKIGLYHTLGMPEDTKAYGNGHLPKKAFFAMCRAVEAERRAMFTSELEHFDRGVLGMVFDTSDRIQHMTPAHDEVEDSAIGQYLIEFDRFLGGVLDKLPANTPVVVFSDHGFSRFDRSVDVNRWLVEQGYLVIDQEAYAQRSPGDNGELFKFVRWDQSRAYAVGFADLYINQQGREGQGIVPAAQAPALAKEIATKLSALQDQGKPVLHKVYLTSDIYQGDSRPEAPDLVLGFKPGYRGSWQSAIGGLSPEVLTDNDKLWQRDHIVDPSFVQGTLITNFPLAVDQPNVLDLAPTVLGLLGLPIPEDMEGQVWYEGASQRMAAMSPKPIASPSNP